MKEYLVKKYNIKMRYVDMDENSKGVPIIFIHGLGCTGSFDYMEVAASIGLKSRRKILIDLIGCGYSDKPDFFPYSVSSHAEYLRYFILDLCLKEVIIFGHSMGGAIAVELCDLIKDEVDIKLLISAEGNMAKSTEGMLSYKIAHYADEYQEKFEKLKRAAANSSQALWFGALSTWTALSLYKLSLSAANTEKEWIKMMLAFEFPKAYIGGEYSHDETLLLKLKNNGVNTCLVEKSGHSMAYDNPKGLSNAIIKLIEDIR